MPFRFVHTADIHLDSPLRSLALRNGELADLIGSATRQALEAIVDLCLAEQVDALIIAGDLYDGDQTSMKTARFLASEMERLSQAGIQVFTIRGNHDALSKITKELVLPPSVKIFGAHAEAVEFNAGNLPVAIHGLSFARPQAPESLLARYKRPISGAINIGIMHTSLAGSPGHDVYAPCNVGDLHGFGFHYWALGHIHQRADHQGSASVIMPGMPQGRDINEAGPKSVSLVTIADDGTITVKEVLTSIAQFERVDVDLTGLEDWRDVADAIETSLSRRRGLTPSPHLVARLRIAGQTSMSWQLRRDADVLRTQAEQRGERVGSTWIEKIELAVQPIAETGLKSADPVMELEGLMREDVLARPGFRDEIAAIVRALLPDIPAESRQFAGTDDAAFEAFIDRLLQDGVEEIVARMTVGAERDS